MKISDLYSYGMATKNEDGNVGVDFRPKKSFWQILFKVRPKERTFYKAGCLWVDKDNGRYASADEEYLCDEILSLFKVV